jgi:hypothetical protein
MVPIAALRAVATSSGVRQRGDGRYEVTGGDPSVTYEAAQEPLDGRDAGLLGFDFKCQAGAEPAVLTVAWATRSRPAGEATTVRFDGADGRLIVPLDAAPRWLLAEDIAQIRIGLANPAACTAFELDHVALFQRAAAAALDGRRSAAPQ